MPDTVQAPTQTPDVAALSQSLSDTDKAFQAELASQQQTAAARGPQLEQMQKDVSQAYQGMQGVQRPQVQQPVWHRPQLDPQKTERATFALAAMALLGGATSKNWAGALSSIDGALKGYAAGNQEAVNDAFKDYQTHVSEAARQQDKANQEYEDTLNNKKLSLNEKLEMLNITAQKWQHDDVQGQLRLKSIEGARKQIEDRMRMATEAQRHAEDLSERHRHNLEVEKMAAERLKKTSGSRSALAEQFRKIVAYDISEVDLALKKIKTAGSKTASPFFMDHESPNWYTRWVKSALTSEEQQNYDVYANRIAMAIVSMGAGGRASGASDAKIAEAKKLVPVPGNDQRSVDEKIAYIQHLRDRANAVFLEGQTPEQIIQNAGASVSEEGPVGDDELQDLLEEADKLP